MAVHACRLAPETEKPSQWFADLIGASVAAIAMAVACVSIVFAQLATKGVITLWSGSHRLWYGVSDLHTNVEVLEMLTFCIVFFRHALHTRLLVRSRGVDSCPSIPIIQLSTNIHILKHSMLCRRSIILIAGYVVKVRVASIPSGT